MQNIFIEFLPPWVETGLQPAFYDKESGTVLQQVSRMYAKMNELIGNVNKFEKDTKDVVDEYIAKFVELHDYVHDYFDNLDVQEEINNKLDAMVEAGTLQEIITTYIQSNVAWTFDTVADMKLATNLVDGSFAQTLGFRSVNDGGASLYKIKTTGTANDMDIIQIGSGSLKAHLIPEEMVRPEQLGAYGDDTHDDSEFIQHLVSNYDYCVFTKTYRVADTIYLKTNNTIDGLNTGIIHADPIDDEESGYILWVSNKNNVTIKNISINSDNTYTAHDGSDHPNWNNTQSSNLVGCLIQWGCENITIENVKLNNLYTDILVNSNNDHNLNKNIIIKDVVSHGGASSPIYLGYIDGCKIDNVWIDRNELCIPRCHFIYCSKNGGQNLEIKNCHFEGNDYTSSLFNFAYANYTYGSSGDNGFDIVLTDTYAKGCTPLSFKNISINFECNGCKFINTPRLRDDGVTYEYGALMTTFPCNGAKFIFNNCKMSYVTSETTNTQALVEYKVDTNAPFEETIVFKNCDIDCHCLTRYNYNSKNMQFYNCNIECEITPIQRSKAGGSILIDDCNMKLTEDYISSSSGTATETVIIKDTLINTTSSKVQFTSSNENWHLYLYNNIVNSPNRLTNYFGGTYGASNTVTNNTFSNGSILTTS